MNRVLVFGSPGSGKSTFARALGERTGLPVTHIDALFWAPGWRQRETELYRADVERVAAGERWIIDGNYTSSIDLRLPRADTIVFLDLPTWLCVSRIVRRRWQYRGRTRPDLPSGCPEKIDFEFLHFALTWSWTRRPKMLRLATEGAAHAEFHRLRSRRAITSFLDRTTRSLPHP